MRNGQNMWETAVGNVSNMWGKDLIGNAENDLEIWEMAKIVNWLRCMHGLNGYLGNGLRIWQMA